MIMETERLILREIDPAKDFEAWARTSADENTVRYLGVKPMNRAEAWRSMAMVMGHWAIRGFGFFSLESKATGEWVGRVGPWYPEGWPAPEIGWAISPDRSTGQWRQKEVMVDRGLIHNHIDYSGRAVPESHRSSLFTRSALRL